MVDLSPQELARARKNNLTPEKYARLKAESKAPYRGLRKFFYVAFGASGLIGAFVFLAKLVAGQDLSTNFPNFALQVGVVALMMFLFRIDKAKDKAKGNQLKTGQKEE
ncbi:MAG: DUF3493 domain-containing protein [Waterburya sp.]